MIKKHWRNPGQRPFSLARGSRAGTSRRKRSLSRNPLSVSLHDPDVTWLCRLLSWNFLTRNFS